MNHPRRRATDDAHVEEHDTFMRGSARAARNLGVLQLTVQILGRTFIWALEVHDARRPPLELADGSYVAQLPRVYPDMPWGYWSSIAGFLVLGMLAIVFYKNQVRDPGRVIDVILGLVPTRWRPRSGKTVTATGEIEVTTTDDEEA